MQRRNFIITLSLILLAPSFLKKIKIKKKIFIKNGWILKNEDI